MISPFVKKYAPSTLNDIIFASPEIQQTINAYSKGYISNHLLLWGSQGTGKSSIANLLPHAIEKVNFPIHTIHASEIKSIKDLITEMNGHRNFSKFYGGRFNRYYLVVEELAFNHESCSKFWTEIERIQEDSLVIITTNDPAKVDRSIRSRCDCIEIKSASAQQFLPRAKWIFSQEGYAIDDSDLLEILTEVENFQDHRKYLQRLENLVAQQKMKEDETKIH